MEKFEDKLKRLEQITSTLEKNEVDIDIAISLFEESLNLSNELDSQLTSYVAKVEKLTKKEEVK